MILIRDNRLDIIDTFVHLLLVMTNIDFDVMCKKKGGKAKCHINLLIGGDVNCNFIFHSKQFLLVSKHLQGYLANQNCLQHVVLEYSSHFVCCNSVQIFKEK